MTLHLTIVKLMLILHLSSYSVPLLLPAKQEELMNPMITQIFTEDNLPVCRRNGTSFTLFVPSYLVYVKLSLVTGFGYLPYGTFWLY